MMDRQKDSETLASSSKLNAKAPEFVPRSASSVPQPPMMQHIYKAPSFIPTYNGYENQMPAAQNYCQLNSGPVYASINSLGSSEWRADRSGGATTPRNGLQDSNQKVLNQVEFYFSDINLATTDQLFRFMSKDPEAYVPLSVVASFKKIKTAISGCTQLANILRNSKMLVVSEDGEKVKRQHPLTESDMEELQSRIVTAENLPEDRSHPNLMKIFSSVGSVKSIRICPPQNHNSGASFASKTGRGDSMHLNSKFHAFLEYESTDVAERAVVELTDECNWRNGLKVRLLIKSVGKSTQVRAKKNSHEVEHNMKKDDGVEEIHFEDSLQQSDDQFTESLEMDYPSYNSQRRAQGSSGSRGKGKGMARGLLQHHMNGGSLLGPPSPLDITFTDKLTFCKTSPVPRMPDGTKGFSFGRGKPIALKIM